MALPRPKSYISIECHPLVHPRRSNMISEGNAAASTQFPEMVSGNEILRVCPTGPKCLWTNVLAQKLHQMCRWIPRPRRFPPRIPKPPRCLPQILNLCLPPWIPKWLRSPRNPWIMFGQEPSMVICPTLPLRLLHNEKTVLWEGCGHLLGMINLVS